MDIVKSFEERATGNGMLNHFDEYSIGQIYIPTDVSLSMNASAGFENAVTHEDEAAASLRSEYCPPKWWGTGGGSQLPRFVWKILYTTFRIYYINSTSRMKLLHDIFYQFHFQAIASNTSFHICLLRPIPSLLQTCLQLLRIPRHKPHLKVFGNSHQSTLVLVVFNIIRFRRFGFTSHDFVA